MAGLRRMSQLMALLLALVAASVLAGCGVAPQPGVVRAADTRAPATVAPAGAATLRAGNGAFAGRMLRLLARTEPTVALSPFSISDALAMTYAGARGRTASQIARALDFRLPPARLHAAFNVLTQSLATVDGPGVTLSVANALFGQRRTPFQQAFLDVLARDYGAGMRTVDFEHAAGAARSVINAWVSDRTHGKIPSLLDPADIDAFTRLVLVNAVYLNAKWQSPFQKRDTAPAAFHAPGGTVQVPTMNQIGTFGYLRGSGYRALELPYAGGRLAFDILLPAPGRLPSLLRRIASDGPLDLLRGLRAQQVGLALPKLLLHTRFELAGALSTLGMPDAFDASRADLSGIAGPPGCLYIKHVVHETYVRVDEAGTEAAAATAVIANAISAQAPPPIVFDVDRPFAFVLRDRQTGAILFLGTVARP
ncbi:MAG: serpin family protein [Actinomycetota bacterium]|nr:serpin family protein [Actinomycetota bacterium]